MNSTFLKHVYMFSSELTDTGITVRFRHAFVSSVLSLTIPSPLSTPLSVLFHCWGCVSLAVPMAVCETGNIYSCVALFIATQSRPILGKGATRLYLQYFY